MRFPLFASLLVAGVFASAAEAQVATGRVTPAQSGKSAPVKNVTKPSQTKNPALYRAYVPPPAPQPPSSDVCTAPDVIVGTGTFNFDNTVATTGVEGQNEAICNQVGAGTAIINDVWFVWTSPATGLATVTACNLTTIDTKIAIYDGTACPVAGAIACNDDNCTTGFQSTLTFNATMGNSYVIQLGLYPGQFPPATPGAGVFSVNVSTPQANDSCATPTAISGLGTFAYDNTAATTGTEGQTEALCNLFATTAVTSDLWYDWTSTVTGTVSVNSCNSGNLDSKFAIYGAAGCPAPGTALACDDDGCGIIGAGSRAIANVVAGNVYAIQIGQYPGSPGGISSFDIVQVVLPPDDDCTTPTAISGPGPHIFDNTFATTGAQGQAEALCLAFGSTVVANDVWMTWTAGASGQHILSFCGNSVDTKVGVYDGAGCPTGPAIACNDDKCGLQTELCFAAVNGQTYTFQIGTYPGGPAPGGVGTFTVIPSTAGVGNDDCNSPVSLGSGLGPHAYDNSTATTGCEGQSEGACNFFGSTTIDNDIWFTWVAPATSGWNLTLCGLAAGQDTKVAVYAGAGCPTGPAISCNDDGPACGSLESDLCFQAVNGQTYTFQVGNYPGAAPGPASFQLSQVVAPPPCQHDNNTSENAVGYPGGSTWAVVWLQRYGNPGERKTINEISAAYGTPLFPGGTPGNGHPTIWAVWDDPTDDSNPTDAVLLASGTSTMQNVDTDILNVIPLGAPVQCLGHYFVGVGYTQNNFNQFPATLDQDGCPANSGGRAWIFGDQSGTANLNNLPANNLVLGELDAFGLPGVWLLRTDCNTNNVGTPYCCGDGTGPLCPCAPSVPNGAFGAGCPNSVNPAGAVLGAMGVASVTADTLQLQGSGMPATSNVLYFQGTTAINAPFGDGRRCAGGQVLRLGQKTNAGGASAYPVGGDAAITVRAATAVPPQPIAAGATRYYQAWYRNAALFCVATATFNLSNGLAVTWQP